MAADYEQAAFDIEEAQVAVERMEQVMLAAGDFLRRRTP